MSSVAGYMDTAPVTQTIGTPSEQDMARYRTEHEAIGLRLLKCEIHAGTRRSICHSVDLAGKKYQKFCNGSGAGGPSCHDM